MALRCFGVLVLPCLIGCLPFAFFAGGRKASSESSSSSSTSTSTSSSSMLGSARFLGLPGPFFCFPGY
ncbi:hypothetical protein AC578_1961 [Pseudocercospora eumusae]|uniref:Uncharacterized protein n=1 Tax=Pseudocercospora eumusae TaxID=321146 RepID=A0A139H265_9PEZI|nr:hypothetical protein AC578_1961 [Pseudocercospora eumusae]